MPPTSPVELRRSDGGDRWVAVADVAGATQLTQQAHAIAEVAGKPSLVLAFVASTIDFRDVQQTLREVFLESELIGCTTSGLVSSRTDSGAVQLVALGGTGIEARAELIEYGDEGCRSAGRAVAEAVEGGQVADNQTLMLLCDGLSGDVAELVRGVYSVSGAGTNIVGGCAGDDLAMIRTHQFANDAATSGGVAAARLRSSATIGVGVAHGWAPVGDSMVITETDGTSVLSIDDRPAMEAYLDVVGAGTDFHSSADFARFAQTRPLGLHDGGAGQVRFVTGGDFERQSLEFLVHIPEGQLVWVMKGDRASVIEATRAATHQALDQLGTARPLGVIAFDCVARRSVIGDDCVHDEIDALRSCLPPATPIGGFYTYGEIARTGGALGLHHQTMVVVAFG